MTLQRIPPHDDGAERAVLGALLLDNRCIPVVRRVLTADQFYQEAHRRIYQAICALADRSTPVDHVTLAAALRAHPDSGRTALDCVGGSTFLAVLTDAVATTANVAYYATIVARLAALRAVLYTTQELVAQICTTTSDQAEVVIQAAQDGLLTAARTLHQRASAPRRVAEDLGAIFRGIVDGIGAEGRVPTGIACYDAMYGGLWPGLVHVIAGRPAMGKSCLALNMATNAALAGRKVLYCCLEDTRTQEILRLLARFGEASIRRIALGHLPPEEVTRILGTAPLLEGLPLWIDDTKGQRSRDVRAVALEHQLTHGLDVLFVDHLGEIIDEGENETAIITRAAMALRDCAAQLQVPLVLVSQLNRSVEQRTCKRPQLADLRQSGAVEQIARFVLFPYRAGYYCGDSKRRDCELIVAKATNFPTGSLRCWMDLAHMYVRAWDAQEDGDWTGDDVSPVSLKGYLIERY